MLVSYISYLLLEHTVLYAFRTCELVEQLLHSYHVATTIEHVSFRRRDDSTRLQSSDSDAYLLVLTYPSSSHPLSPSEEMKTKWTTQADFITAFTSLIAVLISVIGIVDGMFDNGIVNGCLMSDSWKPFHT